MIFLLCCLAVWRISHFIVRENGPFHFMWDARYYYKDNEFLGELLSCVSCTSVWVSIPFAFYLADSTPFFLAWMGLSAITMIVEALYNVLRKGE